MLLCSPCVIGDGKFYCYSFIRIDSKLHFIFVKKEDHLTEKKK